MRQGRALLSIVDQDIFGCVGFIVESEFDEGVRLVVCKLCFGG